jgi:phytoene dehydrogenase-like protein
VGGEPRSALDRHRRGGIAGLYCAWKLATNGHSVTVFECLNRLGGRGETLNLDGFKAECGPMRFELAIQPKFAQLARDLGVEFSRFTEPLGEDAEFPRYRLDDDEKSARQRMAEEREAENLREGEVPMQQSSIRRRCSCSNSGCIGSSTHRRTHRNQD